jgi:leader peptidase (prepilin peptidase)/N-methyltransferase
MIMILSAAELAKKRSRRRVRLARFVACAFALRPPAARVAHVAWGFAAGLATLAPEFPRDPMFGATSVALFALLGFIACFDARTFLIPDRCLLILLALGVALALGRGFHGARMAFAAMIAGYVAIRALNLAYEMLRGEAGIGQGDAKLFAVIGLWTGFEGLLGCLVYAVPSALLSIFIMRVIGMRLAGRTAIPFGPHLALGFWLVWCLGPLVPA